MYNKKGQAALEFMATYGWAILVVMIAIGALAYFGVLNPSKFLSDKAAFPAGFGSDSNKILITSGSNAASNFAKVELSNGFGKTLHITNITLSGLPSSMGDLSTCVIAVVLSNGTSVSMAGDAVIAEGESFTINMTGVGINSCDATKLSTGDSQKIKMDITYNTGDTNYPKTAQGEIFAKVQ